MALFMCEKLLGPPARGIWLALQLKKIVLQKVFWRWLNDFYLLACLRNKTLHQCNCHFWKRERPKIGMSERMWWSERNMLLTKRSSRIAKLTKKMLNTLDKKTFYKWNWSLISNLALSNVLHWKRSLVYIWSKQSFFNDGMRMQQNIYISDNSSRWIVSKSFNSFLGGRKFSGSNRLSG